MCIWLGIWLDLDLSSKMNYINQGPWNEDSPCHVFATVARNNALKDDLRSKMTQESCNILSSLMVPLNNILYLHNKNGLKSFSYEVIPQKDTPPKVYFLVLVEKSIYKILIMLKCTFNQHVSSLNAFQTNSMKGCLHLP